MGQCESGDVANQDMVKIGSVPMLTLILRYIPSLEGQYALDHSY